MSARISFEHELKRLHEKIEEMGSRVEQSIEQLITVLEESDYALAREIVAGDRTVNDMERSIEAFSLTLITRQQPVARDLRQVTAALKVVTDMERIGDHAADIAELVLRFEGVDLYHTFDRLPAMMQEVKGMVRGALEAFIRADEAKAKEIMEQDDRVDEKFNEVKEDIIRDLKGGEVPPDYCVDILMIAKYLERVGDHAVNICEWAVFEETGAVDNVRIL